MRTWGAIIVQFTQAVRGQEPFVGLEHSTDRPCRSRQHREQLSQTWSREKAAAVDQLSIVALPG